MLTASYTRALCAKTRDDLTRKGITGAPADRAVYAEVLRQSTIPNIAPAAAYVGGRTVALSQHRPLAAATPEAQIAQALMQLTGMDAAGLLAALKSRSRQIREAFAVASAPSKTPSSVPGTPPPKAQPAAMSHRAAVEKAVRRNLSATFKGRALDAAVRKAMALR